MTDGDESRRRPKWQPTPVDRAVNHAAYIDSETWQAALDGAAEANYTVGSYLRMVLNQYLSQPRRTPPPAATVSAPGVPRRNIRATAAEWDLVAARAVKESTTRSGVIASAILHARSGAQVGAEGKAAQG